MTRSRIVGVVVMLASILAMVVAVFSGWRSREYAQCQARVNEALITAQTARAQAAEQDRTAMDQLVSDILSATRAGQSRAALERYRETRAANDAERAAHPLPRPPSQTC